MSLSIGITTAPRSVPTLRKMLQDYGAINGQVSETIVFAEPDSDVLGCEYSVVSQSKRLGCMKHWDFALRYLLDNTKSDFVGVFQDDITFSYRSKKAIASILSHAKPERVGYWSLFLANNHKSIAKAKGWNSAFIGWGLAGAVSFIFPRSSAQALVSHPGYTDHVKNYEKNQQIDAIVGQSMLEMKLPGMFYSPSAVRHVGDVSTLGHKHNILHEPYGW